MQTTFDPYAEQIKTTGRRVMSDAGEAASDIKAVAADEIKSLIADVEDLVARLSDLKDADVARVRTKVMRAVDSAKESLAGRADTVKRHAQKVASTADGYVRESPWAAVGLAAVVGAVVGILVARRS